MNLEQLNNTSCRIYNIKNGDKIPIGGSYPGVFDLTVTVDTDNFEQFFELLDKNVTNMLADNNMKQWVSQYAPQFDVPTFAAMYAFDNLLRRKYPNLSENAINRNAFYSKEKSPALSDAFTTKVCKCAEIAILAQLYFEHGNYVKDSRYFGGELLQSSTEEFGEQHSFIVFGNGSNDYIYDPANPIRGNDSSVYFPRIQTIEATPQQKKQFEQKFLSNAPGRKCAFFETKNIFTGQKLYYGAGDGCNIFPSFFISQNNSQTIPDLHPDR